MESITFHNSRTSYLENEIVKVINRMCISSFKITLIQGQPPDHFSSA